MVQPGTERGGATRQRIIVVAERLFAERGVNGVSLREIGVAAGQRNTAAARYHFGSKEGLVDAIFRYRMEPINERRLALIAEFDAAGRGDELDAVIDAYLYPLSEMLGEVGRPSWYLRFSVQAAYVAGTAPTELGRDEWTRGMHLVRTRFLAAVSDVPPEAREGRWTLTAGYIAHALADRELLAQHGQIGGLTPRSVFLAELASTAVALASAPASSATKTALRAERRLGA